MIPWHSFEIFFTHWVNCDVGLSHHCPFLQAVLFRIPLISVHVGTCCQFQQLPFSNESQLQGGKFILLFLLLFFFLGILCRYSLVYHLLQPPSQENKHCGLHRWVESARRPPVQRLLNVADRCGTTLSRTNGIPPIMAQTSSKWGKFGLSS